MRTSAVRRTAGACPPIASQSTATTGITGTRCGTAVSAHSLIVHQRAIHGGEATAIHQYRAAHSGCAAARAIAVAAGAAIASLRPAVAQRQVFERETPARRDIEESQASRLRSRVAGDGDLVRAAINRYRRAHHQRRWAKGVVGGVSGQRDRVDTGARVVATVTRRDIEGDPVAADRRRQHGAQTTGAIILRVGDNEHRRDRNGAVAGRVRTGR